MRRGREGTSLQGDRPSEGRGACGPTEAGGQPADIRRKPGDSASHLPAGAAGPSGRAVGESGGAPGGAHVVPGAGFPGLTRDIFISPSFNSTRISSSGKTQLLLRT
ncbi:pro-resilin-like [Bubalus bubalis]|uniref:pro-resilin-like n=1 Tax=Bubalus bubalis TaxID=89462 RepID=UPI001E1B66FB|nr:pro-resilin-like [Bubalus bubalis]